MDAEAEKVEKRNKMKHQRSHSQNPMPVYDEAYLQQQFQQQHQQPPIAGRPSQSRRPSFSATAWQSQQQPVTPSQPQGGLGWPPSPNQPAQLHRSNTFNAGAMNSTRMPGAMAGQDDLSDIETNMKMATLQSDKSLDGFMSAAEERGRERQRRISGGALGLTSRSRSRAPEGAAMGYGAMDTSQVQNVWDNAQQRQRKISTAERPAFYPQAGGASMGQYQQGVVSQQPSPNMQQGHGRLMPVNEQTKVWEQDTRIYPGGPHQRDDDGRGDWYTQPSTPSQVPQQARTPYLQHQETPSRHAMAMQPQQMQFSAQPSPNTAPQQMWPSRSPMMPLQSQLTDGVPMVGAGAFQPQPSPHQPQYIQMPTNGISGQPSPLIRSNVVQGGVEVYPPGHILAGKPVNPVSASAPFTKTPAHPAQLLKTPAQNAQSFPTPGINQFGDQFAAKSSQIQPVPVAGGYAIPEGVPTRGQMRPGMPQQPPHEFPRPPQLISVPTGGGGGVLTNAGGIVPAGYGGPQQQPQLHPHETQQHRLKYHHQSRPSFGHMDTYDRSNPGASPNPSAGRGGAESDYELLHPPKRPSQHHHHHHEQQWPQQQQRQQQQQQARQTQHGPRFTPQGRFDPFIVIPDLNALGEFPRLPRVLNEMRVTHQDWTAFMQVCVYSPTVLS
jgi:hypothetical protein